uniref:alpha-1,6-mannosylglycoprotein 6-beta-N-acetylglucosaminyltransferase A-like isoform X2 n=1 Tax=Pristiophorus japonicus TaxID=55135 RepID=UPI00398F5416
MFGSLFRRNTSQKLSALLLIFGFIWGLLLLRYTFQHPKHQNSAELREQILELSKRYVRALAEENQNAIDGPHGASMAGYADLKRTIAVLLDDILQRLGKLENKVEYMITSGLTNNTNSTNSNPASAAANKQMNVQEFSALCGLTSIDGFPHCEGKIKWMNDMWKSEACYANNGVNGSVCSFIAYLSEVENFCPMLPVRIKQIAADDALKPKAKVVTSLDGLLEILAAREELVWIKLRLERMKEKWITDMKALAKKWNLENRPKKKILLHLGLLTKESGFKIAENVFKGGPLGELVQWSDLIASVYLLGHNLMLSTSVDELKWYLSNLTGNKDGCPIRGPKLLDLIYIDIVGLKQLRTVLGASFTHYQCLLRVLDSFGTEPEFNHAEYAKKKNHGSPWGKLNLIPKQFYNMFPHTPDNSFLGFVVEQHFNSNNITLPNKIPRTNKALVYGKLADYWKDKISFLDIVRKYAEIHGTFHNERNVVLPEYINNHGILSGHDLHLLLRGTKRKVAHNKRERTRTGGGLANLHPLTPLEQRVTALMGPAWRKATTTSQAGPTLEGEELEANPDDAEEDSDEDEPEENIFQSHLPDQEHGGEGEGVQEASTVVLTFKEVQVLPIEVPAPSLTSGLSVGPTFHGFPPSEAGDSSGVQRGAPRAPPSEAAGPSGCVQQGTLRGPQSEAAGPSGMLRATPRVRRRRRARPS